MSGRGIPVRHRPLDLERLIGVHQRGAFEHLSQRLDHVIGQCRQVGQRLIARPAVLVAVGAAQQEAAGGALLPADRRILATGVVDVHLDSCRSHPPILSI